MKLLNKMERAIARPIISVQMSEMGSASSEKIMKMQKLEMGVDGFFVQFHKEMFATLESSTGTGKAFNY